MPSNSEYQIGEINEGMFTRHTTSARHSTSEDPLSQEYPQLTGKGIERARETARTTLLDMIESSPHNTVVFIGGKSDQERTGETGEVYGEELEKASKINDEMVVLTKDTLTTERQKAKDENNTNFKSMNFVHAAINNNPDKRVVIAYPLQIKELSYAFEDRWVDTKGNKTKYFDLLVKKYKGDHAPCVVDWIENQGKLTLEDGTVLQGPLPDDVAKQYLHGLSRLEDFAKREVPGRPVRVLGVGHQWDLDAVVSYLAKGSVTTENFNESTGGSVINEAEPVSAITVNDKGTSVTYRGQTYKLNHEIHE